MLSAATSKQNKAAVHTGKTTNHETVIDNDVVHTTIMFFEDAVRAFRFP